MASFWLVKTSVEVLSVKFSWVSFLLPQFLNSFLATNTQNNEVLALKTEETKSKHAQLLFEAKVMKALQGGGSHNELIDC